MLRYGINTREITARLILVGKRLAHPKALFKTWGLGISDLAKEHAKAHSKGGKFWAVGRNSIAGQTRLAACDDSGARVQCDHPVAWHKEHGGIIRPKNKRALTIPLDPSAEGKTAASFTSGGRELFVIGKKDGQKENGVLGFTTADGVFKPLFLLRTKVDQKAEPWWPTEQEGAAIGQRESEAWLKLQL